MDINTQLVETIFKTFRLMKEEMAYNSDLLKLSMLQLQALVFLKRNPDVQMTEIAQYFQIELPSATSLIHTITRLKLAEKYPDKKDRRLVRISLTKKGLTLLQDALKKRQEKMKKNLNYLSLDEKKLFLSILEHLSAKLEEKHEK